MNYFLQVEHLTVEGTGQVLNNLYIRGPALCNSAARCPDIAPEKSRILYQKSQSNCKFALSQRLAPEMMHTEFLCSPYFNISIGKTASASPIHRATWTFMGGNRALCNNLFLLCNKSLLVYHPCQSTKPLSDLVSTQNSCEKEIAPATKKP